MQTQTTKTWFTLHGSHWAHGPIAWHQEPYITLHTVKGFKSVLFLPNLQVCDRGWDDVDAQTVCRCVVTGVGTRGHAAGALVHQRWQ